MATLPLADVITYMDTLFTPAKLQNLYTVSPKDERAHLPIITPAPQRPAADFAAVLHWEESEEESQDDEKPRTQIPASSCFRPGGFYAQRLFARGRALARYAAEVDYTNAMHNPALVNQAPPWPPAPELIANPPNWGLPTCSNVAAQRCMGDPGAETHVSAPLADCSERSSRYSSTGGRAGYQQEPSWGTDSTSPPSEDGDEEASWALAEGTAQYFIGRDGNAWPMPPSECMPGGGGPSSLHPSRSSRLEPRCRIVWSADDCEDDQAGDALIPRTREDDSSGVMHSSLSPSAMSDSRDPVARGTRPTMVCNMGQRSRGSQRGVPFTVDSEYAGH